MPKFKLSDFAGGYTPLADGRYSIKILSVSKGETKSGDPRLVFEGEVVEPREKKGRKVVYSRQLAEKSLWVLAGDLMAAGFSDELPINPLEDADGTADYLKGQMVGNIYSFDVSTRSYTNREGKTAESNEFKLKERSGLVSSDSNTNGSLKSAVANFDNV